MSPHSRLSFVAACVMGFALMPAQAENIRIAVLDPASGPFAAPSVNWTKSMQVAADLVNQQRLAGPSNTLEVVQFDNKGTMQESLVLLRTVIDQGFRFIVNGGSSAVYAGLLDAINKHNERNPGKEVLLLTHSNADPELTNGKCSFWSFRMAPNSDMMAEALTTEIAKDQGVRKLYIIGQNYPLGQSVSKNTKEYLKRKRPDIQIVGDDLHPIGQVKDFSPYVAKIRASGADAVTTANWGADLTQLIKAASDANLKVTFYTYYANSLGVTQALASASDARVKNIQAYTPNNDGFVGREVVDAMKKKFNEDLYMMPTHTLITALAGGIKQAGSSDPVKVAFAMEGARFKVLSGDAEMRKTDHQLQMPVFITTMAKVNGKDVRYDQDGSGFGWRIERRIDSFVASQPTSCQMTRPAAR